MKTQKMTLKELLSTTHEARWVGTKDEDGSYRRGLKVVQILGETLPVSKINAHSVIKLKGVLKASGLASSSVNRHLAALSALLSMAEDLQQITWKPSMKREQEPEGRQRVITGDELKSILDLLPEASAQLALFLAETGCRVSEALQLQWVNVHQDSVTLRNTKSGKPRTVPLTEKAKVLLSSLRGQERPFMVNQFTFLSHWNKAKAQTSLKDDPEVVPHALRHTFASRLVRSSVPLQVIQSLLGHSNIMTTCRYSHFHSEQAVSAIKTLET